MQKMVAFCKNPEFVSELTPCRKNFVPSHITIHNKLCFIQYNIGHTELVSINITTWSNLKLILVHYTFFAFKWGQYEQMFISPSHKGIKLFIIQKWKMAMAIKKKENRNVKPVHKNIINKTVWKVKIILKGFIWSFLFI